MCGLWKNVEARAAVVQQFLKMSMRGEPVKKLVAPTAPTAGDREEHTASVHGVFGTWCRECCIGRGRLHQHRAGGRERERESNCVTVIVALAQPLCQQRVQTSVRLLNSRKM